MSGAYLELTRVLGWKRWVVAGVFFAGLGRAALGWVALVPRERLNQWDVVLLVLNNYFFVGILIVPFFVALVSDVMIGDRHASFAFLSVPRAPSRGRWWLWKLEALVVAALLYLLLAVLVLSAVGAWLTRPGWAFSRFAEDPSAAALAGGPRYFVLPPVGIPAAGVLLVAGYTAIAIAAFTAFILAVSLTWVRSWVPVAVSLVVALSLYFVPLTNMIDPRGNLIWSHHSPQPPNVVVQWWASGVWIGAALAIAFFLGRFLLSEGDL